MPTRRKSHQQKFLTKKGRHGTLYKFHIVYKDESPGAPRMSYNTWAYDKEHAEDKFFDSPDSDGWEILSIERMRGDEW